MDKFCVVLYDIIGENEATWVPDSWIYPKTDIAPVGSKKFVYFQDDREGSSVPSYDVWGPLIQQDSVAKEEGWVYPATVMGSFGK